MRGRSSWWLRDQSHPHASEPAPEPVAAATGLPVAAPDPEGVTEALRPDTTLTELRAMALAQASGLGAEPVGCETFIDGRPADKLWVVAELARLERLAILTDEYGPWAAAQHMYGGAR